MRLDKFLSNLKYGSRKTIKLMVKNARVKINDQLIYTSDVKIDPKRDKITVDAKLVFYKENITLAFYKPVGYLSSHKDEVYPSLFKLIKEPFNQFDLKIAGRLDYDCEGLMILTTNGQLIHQITHPNKRVHKVYEVTLNKPFNDEASKSLLDGVILIDVDGTSFNAIALNLSYKEALAYITIDEGKFHQVKKMFEKVGFEVTNLKRIQIGKLLLDLKPGEYREIEESDIF